FRCRTYRSRHLSFPTRRSSDLVDMRLFLILPLSHSEDLADHDLSVALHQKFVPDGLYRANRHREIIRRFGRFPHRNAILGRKSTKEEIRYLADGGFRG